MATVVHKKKFARSKYSLCKKSSKALKYTSRWGEVTCKECLKLRRGYEHNSSPTAWRDSFYEVAYLMRSRMCTKPEIAKAMGVCRITLQLWEKKNPKLKALMLEAEEHAIATVEKSLFARATGFKHRETKLFNHQGTILEKEVIKRHPPEVSAIQFLLTNRAPEKWAVKTGSPSPLEGLVKEGLEIKIGFKE